MGASLPPAGFQHPTASPLSSFMAALSLGITDPTIQVVGDSTGFDATRWVDQLQQQLATTFPNICVLYGLWDPTGSLGTDVTRDYAAWVVTQAGASGQRYLQFVSGTDTATRQLTATEVGDPTTDLTVEVDCALVNWQAGAEQTLAARFTNSAGNKAWRLYVSSTNKVTFGWATDGTTENTLAALTNTYTANQRVRLRITAVASGPFTLWQSLDGGANWTSLGSTSTAVGTISKPAGTPYEIGGRGLTANAWGKFYEVFIRDGVVSGGLNVPIINPQPIATWQRNPGSGAATCGTLGGSTTLYVLNGSRSGENIAYFSSATRANQLVRRSYGTLFIANTGHNEAGSPGSFSINNEDLSNWDTWFTALKARIPGAAFSLCTQNPRLSPASEGDTQAMRQLQQAMWAYRNGWTVFDTYAAFLRDPRWSNGPAPTTLILSDGVHPTVAGSQLWMQTILNSMTSRANN